MHDLIPVKYEFAPSLIGAGLPGMQFDTIHIETRDGFDGRKWAITRRGNCIARDGEWEWEPQPSSRDEEFLYRCRWDSMEEAAEFLRTHYTKETI